MSVSNTKKENTLLVSFLLGFAQILLWGGSYFLLPILSKPIIAEFNWTDEFVSACLSMSLLISGLVSPFVGRTISKSDKNYTLLFSGIVMASGLLLLYFTSNKFTFVTAWLLLGIGMGMGLYDALFASIGKKYGRLSGKYILQITLVSGFTTTLVWPFLSYLLTEFGWRNACLIYALLLILLIFPIHWRTLFHSKSNMINELVKPNKTALPKIKRDKIFYLLVANFSLGSVIMTAVYLYLIAILLSNNISMEKALFTAAFLGPGQVAVRLIDSLIKQNPPIIKAIFSAVLILSGLLILLLLPQFAFIGVFLFGFGNGLRSILRGTLPMKYYRKDAYPIAIGNIARMPLVAQAITPLLGGLFISYWNIQAFLVFNIILAAINIIPPMILYYWKTHPHKINHDHVIYSTEH